MGTIIKFMSVVMGFRLSWRPDSMVITGYQREMGILLSIQEEGEFMNDDIQQVESRESIKDQINYRLILLH